MRVQTTAFVLRTWPLGESDRLVMLFSRLEGKLRGVARGAAASRKRFGGALAVLAEVEVRYQEQEGRDLGRLEWCHLLAPTPGEGRNLEVFYVCAYLAEILGHLGREREADENLYRLTAAATRALAANADPLRTARYFEIWALRLAGNLPHLESCAACGAGLFQAGAVVIPGEEACCRGCAGAAPRGHRLGPQALALIRTMLRQPPDSQELEAFPGEALAEVAGMTSALFLHLLERPFRSAAGLVPNPGSRRRRMAGEKS